MLSRFQGIHFKRGGNRPSVRSSSLPGKGRGGSAWRPTCSKHKEKRKWGLIFLGENCGFEKYGRGVKEVP